MITVTNTASRLDSILVEMTQDCQIGNFTDSAYINYTGYPGNRYYVTNRQLKTFDFKRCSRPSGIWITIQKYGMKFGILSRRYYATLNDAVMVASLWSSLVMNSSTCWNKGWKDCSTYYIYDLEKNELVATVSGK